MKSDPQIARRLAYLRETGRTAEMAAEAEEAERKRLRKEARARLAARHVWTSYDQPVGTPRAFAQSECPATHAND